MEQSEQIEQVEQAVLRIALEEIAGAENMGYTRLPWKAVYKAFKELDMDPKPAAMEPFYWKVIAEAKRWQKEALQKLWGTLGISVPPWVHDRLESKNWEVIWIAYFQKKTPQVQVGFPSLDPLVLRLPKPHPSGGFGVSAWPGGMEVGVKALHARKERAYLVADALTDIGVTLTAVRSFAPVFAFLGLADLERALLALEVLKDGEVRQEGGYLLAREGGTRILFRGSLTGDVDLDGALLLGREVTLGTGEIRARMKVRVEAGQIGPMMHIEEGFIEWGEEVFPLAPPSGPEVGLQERNAVDRLLRDSLQRSLSATSRLIPPPSPPMRALMEELIDGNPLEALKAEDLPSKAYMRLLSHY
jgi:hypothetical protein